MELNKISGTNVVSLLLPYLSLSYGSLWPRHLRLQTSGSLVFFPAGIPQLQSYWSLSCDHRLDYAS